jgi:hypothetical protein
VRQRQKVQKVLRQGRCGIKNQAAAQAAFIITLPVFAACCKSKRKQHGNKRHIIFHGFDIADSAAPKNSRAMVTLYEQFRY